ncbi:hypothetical protein [Streptomyces tubercidicus]
MSPDAGEGADNPGLSPLAWQPRDCGNPRCPNAKSPAADDEQEHERAADGDSETLTLLRARMHHDYERWQRYGPLGRSL